MATTTSPQRFLGLDFQAIGKELRSAWVKIQSWPVFLWFTPDVAVKVLGPESAVSGWKVGRSVIASDATAVSRARFTAVALPDSMVLLRRLSLPALSSAEIAQAVALDVSGANPFPADDLVWGHGVRPSRAGFVDVQVALASRGQIQAHLRELPLRLPAGELPEVWATSPAYSPVVLGGFGESRRLAYTSGRRRFVFGLLLLACLLFLSILATPVVQRRMRAIQAVTAFDALSLKAEPALRQRSELAKSMDTAAALKEILAQRADPLYVMDLLTQALSDDTSLLGVQVQGSKVSINGMTGNAAALMQQLSAKPEFRDVKAPVAATRPLGSPKDVFSIELTLVPRVAPTAPPPAGTPGVSPAGSQAPVLSSLGIPLPTPAGAPPPAPPVAAPRAPGGASFGGGATRPANPEGKAP